MPTNKTNISRRRSSCDGSVLHSRGRKNKPGNRGRFAPGGRLQKHNATPLPSIFNAAEQQEEDPQKQTDITTSGEQRNVTGTPKIYTGDVSLSGSASAILGDIHQVFVTINVASDRQIPDLHGTIGHVTSPCGLLETSRYFRPDAYTHESKELMLFNYSGDEVARSETSQSLLFKMLYRSDPHSVVHVVLCLQMSVRSKYWHTVTPDSLSRKSSESMPADLLAYVAGWLRRNKSSKQYLFLRGILDESFRIHLLESSHDRVMRLHTTLCSRLLNISNTLKHWQCPWYYEDQLPRRELHDNQRSSYSLVYILEIRQWACETRFCPGDIAFESQIYTLRVLHCLQLRACPGVQRLLGVVRDTRDCVVAFLTELPIKGTLVSILQEGNRMGRPVSRERREKWCRQLLYTVAEVHRQTYVVGMLGLRFGSVFAIDADDNVILFALLRPMLINHHSYPGSIPPEYRNSLNTIHATPQTDLFQLGLVLWKIAGNKSHERSFDFCQSSGCQKDSSMPCSEPHANPIALEMFTGEYDSNLIRIINICRSESPDERSTAADLLKMFPGPIHVPEGDYKASGSADHLRVEDYQRLYGATVGCDSCGLICTDHYFHCNLCDKNNFDICVSCFDKDLHCFDAEHLLHEYRARSQTRKCFSNVKDSGQREVFYF